MKKNQDKPDSCPLNYKLTYPHKTRLTQDNEGITDNSTGYAFYRMKSASPNRGLVVVPEEYDREAGDLVKLTSGIESKRKESKCYESLREKAEDVLYLTMCYELSKNDIIASEGERKQDAINNSNFFRKLLESF
jgi:hypothetical protein